MLKCANDILKGIISTRKKEFFLEQIYFLKRFDIEFYFNIMNINKIRIQYDHQQPKTGKQIM